MVLNFSGFSTARVDLLKAEGVKLVAAWSRRH